MFHRFVATGDAALLRPVLHHGRMDLLTTARLFADLAARVCWDSEHPASNESVLSGKEP
jgi:hypothetical protein